MSTEVQYAPPTGPPPIHHPAYAPPPGPPPTHYWQPPALLPAAFPLLSPAQTHSLATQGFTTFPISRRPALHDAATSLFTTSRAFFAQPQPHKEQFQIRTANAQGSEEGWSRVVGEKELLTLRRSGIACPPSIDHEARALWRECGSLMQEVTSGIEQSLGMPRGALDGVVSPECVMPEAGSDRLETLLRMFRYERRADNEPDDQGDVGKGRLVAEPHRDIGLLSLVIGASPGLEVWDTGTGTWIPIEEPPHTASDSGGLTATLLVGETMTRLTNSRYLPGRHRVFVPPVPSSASADPGAEFRFSLVFALRPYADTCISSAALTTPITGEFSRPFEEVRAREIFVAIARTHWNVNTNVKEREAQRLRLMRGGTETAKGDPQMKEKKRWSISSFGSGRGDGERPRRNRWSVFQRVLRR